MGFEVAAGVVGHWIAGCRVETMTNQMAVIAVVVFALLYLKKPDDKKQ